MTRPQRNSWEKLIYQVFSDGWRLAESLLNRIMSPLL